MELREERMRFKYVCGCKQATLFTGLIQYRYCPKCYMPADATKFELMIDEAEEEETDDR